MTVALNELPSSVISCYLSLAPDLLFEHIILLFIDVAEKQGKDKVNENTSLAKLSARLKQTAADEGFTTVDNDGVGNCMFYALADQLQHVKGLELSHLKVRQSIVQFLRNNPQWVSDNVIGLVYCFLVHVLISTFK